MLCVPMPPLLMRVLSWPLAHRSFHLHRIAWQRQHCSDYTPTCVLTLSILHLHALL